MQPKDAGIRKAYEVLKEAREGVTKATYRAIRYCKHKQIGEATYKPSEYGNSEPPERVCLRCGLREVGWGIGHIVLTYNDEFIVAKLTRQESVNISTVTLYEPDKSKLLRNEASLHDIVRAKLSLPELKQTTARRAAKKKALAATWAKRPQ